MDEARAEARKIADTAAAELAAGTSFDQVARTHSDGTHAPDGGQWGWVARGALRERLDPVVEALYALPETGMSKIIESDDSFFIARCDEVDPGYTPTFETLQPELQQRYAQIAYSQRMQDLLAEHRRRAQLDPDELERFYEAVVATALQP